MEVLKDFLEANDFVVEQHGDALQVKLLDNEWAAILPCAVDRRWTVMGPRGAWMDTDSLVAVATFMVGCNAVNTAIAGTYMFHARVKKVVAVVDWMVGESASFALGDKDVRDVILNWPESSWETVFKAAGQNQPSEASIRMAKALVTQWGWDHASDD